jgi:hypothetical protein
MGAENDTKMTANAVGYGRKDGPGGAINATRSLTEAPDQTGDRLVTDPTEQPRQAAPIHPLDTFDPWSDLGAV